MKFSCTQENLYQGLQVVSHATSKNNTLPILNNVLLKIENKELKLLSTNLEIAVNATVRAKIEEVGEITAPAMMITIPAPAAIIIGVPISGLSAERFSIIPAIMRSCGSS